LSSGWWRNAAARLIEALKDVIYGLLVILAAAVVYPLFRLRVYGRRNLKGGGILVARHRSYWDIPLICVACGPRYRVNFIARRGLLRNPLFAPFVWGFATVIDREHFGPDDYKRTIRAARRSHILGIFPEGTTRPGARPRTGAVRLAELLRKPLIPVNILPKGPYPPKKFPPRYPRVTVHIGAPIPLEELARGLPEGTKRTERYRLLTHRLMEIIDSTSAH